MTTYYFDHASTTPTDPEVLAAMQPFFFEKFGNASSPHALGREARKAIEDSRAILALFIGARPEEIIFNSGASEGNNHALLGIARSLRHKGNHVLVSQIEHHSVIRPAQFLEQEGFMVTYLPVDKEGMVDPEYIRGVVDEQTILVAVMHASNEIGTIQPLSAIGRIAREKKIMFHVDAVQTVGHLPLNVEELQCDSLSLSAHKFFGPKGVGALYVRKDTPLVGFLLGGDQERGRRASTPNTPGIVGLGKALELCHHQMSTEMKKQLLLRDHLIEEVVKRIPETKLNGHRTQRLPNNAHFSFNGVDGEALLMSLDMAGIAASQGSACTSGALEPSHVLTAIGLPVSLAHGSLRISLGRWTTEQDVDYLLEKLPEIVEKVRK